MKRGPKMMALGDPRGSCGIFVCCDEKRESKALNEVADLLNIELDEHFPIQQTTTLHLTIDSKKVDNEDNDDKDEDVSVSNPLDGGPENSKRIKSVAEEIADELANLGGVVFKEKEEIFTVGNEKKTKFINLKSHLKHKRARFMDVGGRGLGLVWIDQKETSFGNILNLLDPIFEAALVDKKLPTRFTSRMIPLQSIVTASALSITEAALNLSKTVLPINQEGQVGIKPVISFKVEMRSRSNTTLKKDEIISSISKAFTSITDCHFRPDHLSYDVLVLIEVVKFLAGVTVIKRSQWERFERYNIRIAAETIEERAKRFAKAAANRFPPTETIDDMNDDKDEIQIKTEEQGGVKEELGGVFTWSPSVTSLSMATTTTSSSLLLLSSTSSKSVLSSSSSSPPSAIHNSLNNRFCIKDRQDCYLEYSLVNTTLELLHTFVSEDCRGKGFGEILLKESLTWAEQEGLCVQPTCSFIAAKMRLYPKWKNESNGENVYSYSKE
jgi:uncharacterized protein